jgi:glycosyltransferase involved in cell wall biosynthesis
MRIAIDARFFGPEGTGIGKYTEKLVENLQKIDKRNEYFIILRRNNWPLFQPRAQNFSRVLADARWYSLKEQVLLPATLIKIKPDLVHFPHFNIPLLYPGKFVVTIHDVTVSEFKSAESSTLSPPIYQLKHFMYRSTIKQAIKRSKKIFVPSNFIQKKICKEFNLPIEKVVTTYEATDEVFAQVRAREISVGRKKELLAKYGIKEPFIIYVGRAAPHKNLEVVLEALRLSEKQIYFVHSASRDFFVERIRRKAKDKGLENKYVTTGFVPDSEIADLLKMAECLVFPSLSEGFGLPGLEALSVGCSVVCSSIPVFREIYGDAAVYFDPKNPKDLSKKIELIVGNTKLKGDLRKKGFDRVNKYSWEDLAKKTLEVYNQLA